MDVILVSGGGALLLGPAIEAHFRHARVLDEPRWANAVLFGAYHWHMPWRIPASIMPDRIDAYPSKRFRCAWFGVILHGAHSLFFLVIMLGLVLGLA